MRQRIVSRINALVLAAAWTCAVATPLAQKYASAAEPVSFRSQVAPILLQHCIACHGPKNAKGSYRVDSFTSAVGSSDSASAAFVAGNAQESEALRRITSDDPDERMPLDADPLSTAEIELVRRWIDAGLEFDGPDPRAPLVTIVPPPQYVDPPAAYPRALPITALSFNAAGDELFVSGYHEITVWSPVDGRLLRRIKNMPQRIYRLALSSDGKLLAAAGGAPGQRGEVRLIDLAAGTIVRVLNATSDVVFDAAFSPSGERLAAAGADGAIRVFDVATGEQQLAIGSHDDWVLGLAWSLDGSSLASASRDKSAKVFDAKTGDLKANYAGHSAAVWGVVFSSDGAEVFSAGDDRKVHGWSLAEAKKTGELTTLNGESPRLAAGAESLFVLATGMGVRELRLKTRAPVRDYASDSIGDNYPQAAAHHAGTARLAVGGFGGQVRIWNTADGSSVATFVAAPGIVSTGKGSP
jgi:mono/diheme cytochrome c family protein